MCLLPYDIKLADVPAPPSGFVFITSAAVTLTDGLLFCSLLWHWHVFWYQHIILGCIFECIIFERYLGTWKACVRQETIKNIWQAIYKHETEREEAWRLESFFTSTAAKNLYHRPFLSFLLRLFFTNSWLLTEVFAEVLLSLIAAVQLDVGLPADCERCLFFVLFFFPMCRNQLLGWKIKVEDQRN